MRIRRLAGDLVRASIIYALTAFASGGVLDPVRTASADPLSLDGDKGDEQTWTYEAPCDRTFQREGVATFFAQHAFGRPLSPRQLSGVRVLAHIAPVAGAPPGYPYALVTKGIFVREGAVAVECGDEHSGKTFDQVTFVVPRTYKLDVDTTNPW